MGRLLIIIDDQPNLFTDLRRQLFEKDSNLVVVISCRYQEVLEYLKGPQEIIGILLKFNLPFGTGYMFSKMFVGKQIPIFLTENDKYHNNKIKESLNEINYPVELVSFIDLNDCNFLETIIKLVSSL